MALVLSTAIAIPVGIFSAERRGRAGDTLTMGVAQLGVAVPNFWFALILIYVFAVWLRLVPAGGFPGWSAGVWPALKALILPAVALALPQAAILARVTRSALLEVLNEDYIRTARAKGMPRRAVLWRHALRNAMIPVLTILGLQFAFLLAGTIIIENVFYLPGLGRLVFQAITQRDLIVVESVVMLLVAAVIAVNILVDISYAIVDPRLRSRAMTAPRRAAARDARRASSPRRSPAARSSSASLITAADRRDGCRLLCLDALRRHPADRLRQAAAALGRRTGSAPTISAATSCR